MLILALESCAEGNSVGRQRLKKISMATMNMEYRTLGWEANTNPGIGIGFQLRKDFRISRKVLLGIAGHAFLATMKDKGGGPQWNSGAFGITAALTYVPRGFTAASY
jgi:hypothetical protein